VGVTNRLLQTIVWSVLALTVASIAVAYVAFHSGSPPLPTYGTMPDFNLTDQNGRPVHLADLRGKIWIADVIFTRCAGQCPVMTSHLKSISDVLPASLPVRFVTFTTDPAYDTPAVMKKYAQRYNADESRWLFLTGPKPALKGAIVDGLKLTAMDKADPQADNPNDLFIHSAKFVLIDGAGQIRGYFDGETEEAVAQTAEAAKRLAAEK
jgi:protein SCO1/2